MPDLTICQADESARKSEVVIFIRLKNFLMIQPRPPTPRRALISRPNSMDLTEDSRKRIIDKQQIWIGRHDIARFRPQYVAGDVKQTTSKKSWSSEPETLGQTARSGLMSRFTCNIQSFSAVMSRRSAIENPFSGGAGARERALPLRLFEPASQISQNTGPSPARGSSTHCVTSSPAHWMEFPPICSWPV
jgi:hypothetical protein